MSNYANHCLLATHIYILAGLTCGAKSNGFNKTTMASFSNTSVPNLLHFIVSGLPRGNNSILSPYSKLYCYRSKLFHLIPAINGSAFPSSLRYYWTNVQKFELLTSTLLL